MLARPTTILGVNPGAKHLGLAVLQERDLRSWGVKNIPGRWSRKRTAKIIGIIDEHVSRYNCKVVCLKMINPSRSSKQILNLVEKIKDYCNDRGIKVYEFSNKNLKAVYSSDDLLVSNKKALAEAVVKLFPVLFHELSQENSHRNAYHIRMFEAVALALAAERIT